MRKVVVIAEAERACRAYVDAARDFSKVAPKHREVVEDIIADLERHLAVIRKLKGN